MAKVSVASAGRGNIAGRVNWRQMSSKRHTEATPPSHVPIQLLAMRHGVSRVVDAPELVGAQGRSGVVGDSLARLLFSATTHCDRLCVD
jgi:hypothetical protein